MARIPASEQTRKRIAKGLGNNFDKSALLRKAVRLIVEEALEAKARNRRACRAQSDGHGHNRRSVYFVPVTTKFSNSTGCSLPPFQS